MSVALLVDNAVRTNEKISSIPVWWMKEAPTSSPAIELCFPQENRFIYFINKYASPFPYGVCVCNWTALKWQSEVRIFTHYERIISVKVLSHTKGNIHQQKNKNKQNQRTSERYIYIIIKKHSRIERTKKILEQKNTSRIKEQCWMKGSRLNEYCSALSLVCIEMV